MMNQGLISKALFFAIFLLPLIFIFSGCVYQSSSTPSVPVSNKDISCKEFCEQKPHIQCVGEWNISGEFPDCKCEFNCSISEADNEKEEIEGNIIESTESGQITKVNAETYKDAETYKETDVKTGTDLKTGTGSDAEKNKLAALHNKLLLWKKEGKRSIVGVSSNTIKVDENYWMYFTRNGIELAVSEDGLNFEEKGTVFPSRPDFMVTNPAVIKLESGFRMFYEGKNLNEPLQHRRLYSAFSEDGLKWKDEGLRFEDIGNAPGGKIFVSVPEVIEINGKLYLYYTRGITLAVAVSEDKGISWKKVKDIIFPGIKVGMDPDIIKIGDGFKLFFTTAESPDLQKAKFYILSASSLDGLNFILDEGIRLKPAEGKNIVSDVDVISIGNKKYRMYYSQASDFSFSDCEIFSAVSEE